MVSSSCHYIEELRDFSLSSDREEALYQQLYNEIRKRILTQQFMVGMRLPASRQLAKDLKVSRNTVQQALWQLQAGGYLVAKRGSGVFVTATIPDHYH